MKINKTKFLITILLICLMGRIKAQDIKETECDGEAIFEIKASKIYEDAVSLNWFSFSDGEFEITYGLKGFSLTSSEEIIEKITTAVPFEFIGQLQPNTTYDFYVKLKCQKDIDMKKISVSTLASLKKMARTRSVSRSTKTNSSALDAEKKALLDIYNATNGKEWRNTKYNQKPWLESKPVKDWFGVKTDGEGYVTELQLYSNNLQGEIGESIKNLTKLESLNLGSNKITKLPAEIGSLSQLKYLRLYNNQLSSLPSEIGNLKNLSLFAVNQNKIDSLPATIGNLASLSSFYVYENQLTNIPSSIGKLSNLTTLSLSNNKLISMPKEIGELDRLGDLLLDENPITSLPNSICNLTALWRLSLDNEETETKLSSIPSQIGNLTNLQYLTFNHNEIADIPASIIKLTSLKWLDLSYNQISKIPDDIGNFKYLVRLYLSYNQIENVPTSIKKFQNLTYLGLKSNKLKTIPSQIGTLANLKWLYVQENYLNFNTIEYLYNFVKGKPSFKKFTYKPQGKTDKEETINITVGKEVKLSSNDLTSANNSYQWYKDGIAIAGATKKELVLTDVQEADSGVYHFKATNSIIKDLTLQRHPITLKVSKYPVITPVSLAVVETTKAGSFRPAYEKKYMLSGWVKEKSNEGMKLSNYSNSAIRLYTVGLASGSLEKPVFIGDFYPTGNIIDGWQRIEGFFSIETYQNDDQTAVNNLVIELKNTSSKITSYFDDIRIYPFHGSMKSFVYDNETKKLMAELDENNFATYYEYDKEGGLVRVKKETNKGIFTIQETRSSNAKK